jgi:hypothetical protein
MRNQPALERKSCACTDAVDNHFVDDHLGDVFAP